MPTNITITSPIPEGGTKNDTGKPRLAFIPSNAIFGIGQAFEYGSKKYADWNYKKGLSATRLSSALLRHLFQWLGGEDLDKESGLSHLYHAGACICMLIDAVERIPALDDRYKK